MSENIGVQPWMKLPATQAVMAALARRLGVPFRSGGNLCASKIPDAKAAYESAATFSATASRPPP